MKENIKILNNSLKGRPYLVGNALTVADLQLTLCVVEMQQLVLDSNFRNSLNNLNNHFKAMCENPVFKQRMGAIRQGKKQMMPANLAISNAKPEKVEKAKKGKWGGLFILHKIYNN